VATVAPGHDIVTKILYTVHTQTDKKVNIRSSHRGPSLEPH